MSREYRSMGKAELDGRKLQIHRALVAGIEHQAATELSEFNLVALAVAIDAALGGDGVMPGEEVDEGKTPAELNAANDV
jgi:hypothetical protein